MFKQKYRMLTTLVLIALAVGGITTIAIAGTELPWMSSSAEPGYEPSGLAPSTVEKQPLQPDENGYTGPTPEGSNTPMEPSGVQVLDQPPDWDSFFTEPQPDDNLDGKSVTEVAPNYDPLFSYAHVAGSALRPRDSSNDWTSSGSGGCIYLNGGSSSGIVNIHLDIPDGSLIEYLRIYYYDASDADSIAFLTYYDDAGGLVDLTYVYSDGNAGYGTMLSPQIAHEVDVLGNSYVLNWRPFELGSNMMLCGLRVAYHLPD